MSTVKLPSIKRHKSLKEALASATAEATEQHGHVVTQLKNHASGEKKDLWPIPNSFQPKK